MSVHRDETPQAFSTLILMRFRTSAIPHRGLGLVFGAQETFSKRPITFRNEYIR